MSNRDLLAALAIFGAALMVLAASFVDWRAGVFVAGLVLWVDAR